jgi:RNA 2',3'-cyclic 3'-phosphodiesterase
MHITIAFLGRTPDERLPDVTAAVETAASAVKAFDVELDRPGRFPPTGRPRVVYLGVGAGAPAVLALGERILRELQRLTIPFDAKPLRAHVTLGRMREDADLADARAVAAATAAMRVPHLRFRIDGVTVFESVLSPRGARYMPRATAALQAGPGEAPAPVAPAPVAPAEARRRKPKEP